MERVTGIGGVFIKSKDTKALAAWYDKHLGFSFGENLYVGFKWINENNPSVPGNTVFSFFKEESEYFDPSSSPFMINFRVKGLKILLETLKEEGVGWSEKFQKRNTANSDGLWTRKEIRSNYGNQLMRNYDSNSTGSFTSFTRSARFSNDLVN